MAYNYTNTLGANGNINGMPAPMAKDNFWTNMPARNRYVQQTGIEDADVTLMEMRKFMIDVDANIKRILPPKYALNTILEFQGAGASIKAVYHTWQDIREGDDQIEQLPIDVMRVRDIYAANGSTKLDDPFAIGAIGEMGGKLAWQTVSIKPTNTTEETINWDIFEGISRTPPQHITIGSSEKTTDNTTGIASLVGELKEVAPVPMVFDNAVENCIALGYSRPLGETQGRLEDYIKVLKSILEIRDYVKTSEDVITWSDAHMSTSTEIKNSWVYTHKGSAKMVHQMFDAVYTKEGSRLSQRLTQIMGIKQFIFNAHLNQIVLILSVDNSNLDLVSKPVLREEGDALTPGTWVTPTLGVIPSSATALGRDTVVGEIVQITSAHTLTATQAIATVPVGFLFEEVNSAKPGDKRMFAPANGLAPEGWTRMAPRLMLNLWTNQGEAVASSQGFDLRKAQGGTALQGTQRYNAIQLFQSDPWGHTTFQKDGGNPDIAKARARDRVMHIAKFAKLKQNAILYSRMSNRMNETNAGAPATWGVSAQYEQFGQTAGLPGDYAGTMAGLFSYQDFPFTYARLPFTMMRPGYDTTTVRDGGEATMNYCNKLAKALNRDGQERKDHTCVVSETVIERLGLIAARVVTSSNENGNVFGTIVRYNKPQPDANLPKWNLGLETFDVRTRYGNLKFIVDTSLDLAVPIPVPRFLLGKPTLNPRYAIIALDKANIKLISHADRPDRIYGGLQANNNPHIFLEGMSGSASLEVRNPDGHMIVDIDPIN